MDSGRLASGAATSTPQSVAGADRASATLALHRTSAAEQAADHLTALILDGFLGAGERLRESALAESLGISRNSVREGIRLLEHGRLVRYEMHRGAGVVTPSIAELDDLFRTRLHLETLAVGVEPTPERAAAVEHAFDEHEAAARTGHAREIVAVDMAFHAALVAGLDSARLSAFFASLTTELGYYLLILSHTDDAPEHVDEAVLAHHRRILDTVLSGEVGEAKAALTEHLRDNHDRIRQILEAGDAGPGPGPGPEAR